MPTSIAIISMLLLGLSGVLGWWYAVKRGMALDSAIALSAERYRAAMENAAAALSAQGQLRVSDMRVAELIEELNRERQSRKELVDALAKSGAAIGGQFVDDAFDDLYPDGRGQGSLSGGGAGNASVSGELARTTGKAKESGR